MNMDGRGRCDIRGKGKDESIASVARNVLKCWLWCFLKYSYVVYAADSNALECDVRVIYRFIDSFSSM